MKTKTLKELFKQAANGVMRKSSIMTLVIIACCMFILGILMMFSINLTNIGKQLSDQIGVNVFLVDEIEDETKETLRSQIIEMEEVSGIVYISKEEALNSLKQNPNYSVALEVLDHNPLPESYKVDLVDYETVTEVAAIIETFEGVDEVQFGERYVENMVGFMRTVWLLTIIIGALAIFAISMIVGNSIKLIVYARRKEIEIMKLVGATDSFIQIPFVFEGALLGVVGSILSIFLVLIGYKAVINWASRVVPFLPLVFNFWTLFWMSFLLIIIGIATGSLSSLFSTRKHIKV